MYGLKDDHRHDIKDILNVKPIIKVTKCTVFSKKLKLLVDFGANRINQGNNQNFLYRSSLSQQEFLVKHKFKVKNIRCKVRESKSSSVM